MKPTMDSPEGLVRESQLRTVREGRKRSEVAEEIFRRGLVVPVCPAESRKRRRIDLPLIPAPPGAKPFELSGERLLKLVSEAANPLQ